ncbi:MAG: 6-phosphogluconate dehydrogenase (decarboxylating), partial [Nitrospiraceae bacterium]
MQLGMIGLGRMGANMTERLVKAGHQVIAYDRNPEAIQRVLTIGATEACSLRHLVESLSVPRAIWLMLPAGDPVDQTLHLLLSHLQKGDLLIDGGNSHYKDSIRRAAMLKEHQLAFVDVGTSGGIWGLARGYSLTIGGELTAVKQLTPIFEALAPSPDRGWGYVGPSGAGHFVKMIHNGIEYGMMAAIAEGLAVLRSANIGKRQSVTDAETAPLRRPENYQYD